MKVNDLRNGMIIKYLEKYLQVLSFEKTEEGLRVDVKNLQNDLHETITFQQEENIERVMLTNRDLEYSFLDGDVYNFMDIETYDPVTVKKEMLAPGFCYARESDVCKGAYDEDDLIRIYPPYRVNRKIVSISTSKNGSMLLAKLDNDSQIEVPSNCREGDTIVIDTASGIVLGISY